MWKGSTGGGRGGLRVSEWMQCGLGLVEFGLRVGVGVGVGERRGGAEIFLKKGGGGASRVITRKKDGEGNQKKYKQ